jgi:DNA-binding NtrC family response regulator
MMSLRVVLLNSDRQTAFRCLERWLCERGFTVRNPTPGSDRCEYLRRTKPDLIVVCAGAERNSNGLYEIERIRSDDSAVPIVVVSAERCVEHVIAAFRLGINDYFTTPITQDELIDGLLRHSRSRERPVSDRRFKTRIVGDSVAISEIKSYVKKLAPTDCTVLITGETGTGKELVADEIRKHSRRGRKPYVCINCSALPDNLLESELFGHERGAFTGAYSAYDGKLKVANGGTVFLDEIGDMSLRGQAKILRVIENKEFYRVRGTKRIPIDVRFVAASNRNPENLVEQGKFRKDLYYRLNVTRIHLPPLRERTEDILPLTTHYINEFNRRFELEVEGISEAAISLMLQYQWPGNVRELKNVLEAAFINMPKGRISIRDLPIPFRKRLKEAEGRPASERDALISALSSTNWNKSKAAEKLQWSRMTLYRKMAKYRIVSNPQKQGGFGLPHPE